MNKYEGQLFEPLATKHELVAFSSLFPLHSEFSFPVVRLPSPVDLPFGPLKPLKMPLLNRLYGDAHVLFGLEEKLNGFDIAHCAETYYYYTQQCINAKEKGYLKKIVSTVWENIPFGNQGIYQRRDFKRRAFKYIDKFIASTIGAKQALIKEGCAENKIVVLYPGVDLGRFKPGNINNYGPLRRNRGIKLLFAGRLVPEKGIRELLSIYQNLWSANKDLELVIVGEGGLLNEIKTYLIKNRLNKVYILGAVPYEEMPNLYNICDIFVHPVIGSRTWKEQYGMVLVEAMACGLPIVAADNGAVKEVVGNRGIVADANLLEANIKKLLADKTLRDKLSKRANLYARKNLDSRKYALNLEHIYQEVI